MVDASADAAEITASDLKLKTIPSGKTIRGTLFTVYGALPHGETPALRFNLKGPLTNDIGNVNDYTSLPETETVPCTYHIKLIADPSEASPAAWYDKHKALFDQMLQTKRHESILGLEAHDLRVDSFKAEGSAFVVNLEGSGKRTVHLPDGKSVQLGEYESCRMMLTISL